MSNGKMCHLMSVIIYFPTYLLIFTDKHIYPSVHISTWRLCYCIIVLLCLFLERSVCLFACYYLHTEPCVSAHTPDLFRNTPDAALGGRVNLFGEHTCVRHPELLVNGFFYDQLRPLHTFIVRVWVLASVHKKPPRASINARLGCDFRVSRRASCVSCRVYTSKSIRWLPRAK